MRTPIGKHRQTAIHEAAHAVLAIEQRARLVRVSVDGKGRGRTRYVMRECDLHKRPPIILAGLVANEMISLNAIRDEAAIEEGAERDRKSLGRLYETLRVPRRHRERLTERHERTAREFLRRDWPAVEALADELERHGTLTGEQVLDVVLPILGRLECPPIKL